LFPRKVRHVNTLADELTALAALATRINRLSGPNSHAPGNWYHERDEIARALARSVGRLRQALGIRDCGITSFAAAGSADSGVASVRQARGTFPTRAIPVERRGKMPTRHQLEAALRAL
jgi:hypothetical protein